ncbi:flagellar hook-associated protein [Escherichia coli]|uniref:flagellar hook-associated protein n=1 Tax=Escherichia sp. MOD1-EC7003 TaxID=2093900 RepID=UPI000CF76E68|nr:flagellar hook-associated protein [Escherichia sp. MOD1-EC7003]EGO8359919.1 flagellar hook-associated protein [Escherichia coli]EGO8377323.1 flagellar hook-associated protein [Escherichia coli]EHR8837211.1 flagellar hook-associated protein [Escherichia coli]MCH0694542.1 flagellar hook-associated protein [Escherichia coli]
MQVGLTSSSLATGGAHSAAVSSSTVAPTQSVRQKLPATASEYPASPLITTRPQRYSVQLNDQITTLQQADHYLGQLEQQLLDYRHSQRKGGQAQSSALMQMLDNRIALSGGAVDRQLQPVLQGEARVTFHSPDLANLVHNPTPGTRMFSVFDGRQTQFSAVMLSDDAAGQYQTRLTNALRRVGMQVHQQADGISFSTTEKQWPDIERTLSVRTDGDKSAFMPLKTFAEPSQAERLAQSLQQGGVGISQMLENINQQRAQMAVQQEKARQLIDGMSRFPQTENAVQASENLGGVLDSANHNYQVLLQAVNGQARISSQTVRSLLG